MNKLKMVLSKTAEFLGFKRNSKYVNEYIHRTNIRSGVYMAAVVVILEIWLVIRQHQKYIIPLVKDGQPYFKTLFDNTSLFWIMSSAGRNLPWKFGLSHSLGHRTFVQGILFSIKYLQVPPVAYSSYPCSASIRQAFSMSAFCTESPVESRMRFSGIWLPTEMTDVSRASFRSSPRQPTSPVEDISTPSIGSACSRRANENWDDFTPT